MFVNNTRQSFGWLLVALLFIAPFALGSPAKHDPRRHHLPKSDPSQRRDNRPAHKVLNATTTGNRNNNGNIISNNEASPLLTSPYIWAKYDRTSQNYRQNTFPHLTSGNGAWAWTNLDWWTSGFYPGTLYLLEDRKRFCAGKGGNWGQNVDWAVRGRQWSQSIQQLESGNSVGHDVGFLAYPFMAELKLNPNNEKAKQAVRTFASQLANRFSSTVGCTRSWDSSWPDFLVIMDNMMNLELLFIAADLDGKDNYRTIARTHADTTMRNHLRDDGSSFHVVKYNEQDGRVTARYTAQGYADWSTWSRGQAWGIYGFITMYRLTGDESYLHTAEKMGNVWLNRLSQNPEGNGVPKWDFDAPEPTSRDTSAAAIAAVGFLELAKAQQNLGNPNGSTYWSDHAIKVLSDTANLYLKQTNSWDAILSDGTSNFPSGVKNTGLVYGDYYFVQAGNMLLEMGLIQCPV